MKYRKLGHFESVPRVVIFDTSISDGAKITYLVICQRCCGKKFTWVSQATLAQDRGKSISSIKRHIVELVKRKLILRTERIGNTSISTVVTPRKIYGNAVDMLLPLGGRGFKNEPGGGSKMNREERRSETNEREELSSIRAAKTTYINSPKGELTDLQLNETSKPTNPKGGQKWTNSFRRDSGISEHHPFTRVKLQSCEIAQSVHSVDNSTGVQRIAHYPKIMATSDNFSTVDSSTETRKIAHQKNGSRLPAWCARRPKATGTPYQVTTYFAEVLKREHRHFASKPTAREFGTVKRLIKEYGIETVLKMCEVLVMDWSAVRDMFNLKPNIPTLWHLYTYRRELSNGVLTGNGIVSGSVHRDSTWAHKTNPKRDWGFPVA